MVLYGQHNVMPLVNSKHQEHLHGSDWVSRFDSAFLVNDLLTLMRPAAQLSQLTTS